MSRVAMIDKSQAPLLTKRFFERGDPGAIVATLAHVPELLETTAPFLASIYGPSALPPRLKEIVVLRTSALQDCRYCVETHTVVALDSGLSRDEVLDLCDERDIGDLFDDARERAVLAWVDRVARGPGIPSDGVANDLRAHFSDAEIVEITMVAAATLMLNRFCTPLGLPTASATLDRLSEEGLR
ncbi:MAG TPA: carboxymuconolactone decarboxylase family protein [Actinomycetota bacterium]|jgi:AhpD family alkylhydroperoxidase|nr:carboxymuconolactone decarboxylase family protein [Actinomycetota bacterium]